ncbi:hypothetical protein H4683_001926 [Filibacter limicola]|uniref:Uncharacterized protein n=1 Tax=Sporosarcina limicola TaxID=34101 RepID=A0A927MJ27_9BACL|nr:hypothetical protein [Sporosarcina limicola]
MNKNSLRGLFQEVSLERRELKNHLSSEAGYKLKDAVEKIVDMDVFKDDYLEVTMKLFFNEKEVQYENVILSLRDIINSEVIPEEIRE